MPIIARIHKILAFVLQKEQSRQLNRPEAGRWMSPTTVTGRRRPLTGLSPVLTTFQNTRQLVALPNVQALP
jgi:hypothetical protein